jgi:nucleoside-diphosphate-sugar epimerase
MLTPVFHLFFTGRLMRPAEFLRENLGGQNNVIDAASQHGVKKLLCPGSPCIYPQLAPQPTRCGRHCSRVNQNRTNNTTATTEARLKMAQRAEPQNGVASSADMLPYFAERHLRSVSILDGVPFGGWSWSAH